MSHDSPTPNHDSEPTNTLTVNSLDSNESQSAYIHAELGDSDKFITTTVLVDTGSDYDVIDLRLLNKLRQNNINCTLLKPKRRAPLAANNIRMTQIGDVVLDIKLVNQKSCNHIHLRKVRFNVLSNITTPCILGINTLREKGLYIKGNTIKIGGLKICSILEDETVKLDDTFIDENNRKWGIYTSDPILNLDTNLHGSENHMVNQLENDFGGDIEKVNDPWEMKPGKFLVLLKITDDPPNELKLKGDHSRLLNELKHCNTNRKFITDDVIKEMVQNSNFTKSGKTELMKILQKYKSVFSSSSFDVGKYTGAKAHLDFKDGEINPVFVPVRRIPHSLRDWLGKHLLEMEEKKIITKCKGSTWNSPLFLVKKKDKTFRPVSDFRALNKQLADIYYPIPFITDLLDSLHGTKFFSSVDLRSGFYNIELDDESTYCTAFSALGQTYKYLRLPQGIKISPIIFQQIMSEIFHDDPAFKVYMDDVLVASRTEKDALNDIRRLLKRFLENGFLLNPSKCVFGSKRLNYLGYEISHTGWTINKSRVDDLLKVKPPVTTTEVRSFTGLCNFYLQCIPNLQRTLQPLHQLTGKKKFRWDEKCQQAFDLAKKKLAKATTMAFPSMKEEDTYFLTTDASDLGWGGCLSQYQSDIGYEVPLSFSSGSFTNSELNWPIKEKECFSLVKNLRNYETYLFGRKFVWRTDNRALSYLHSTSVIKSTALKSVTPKVSRWIDYINEFDFAIEHFQGNTDEMSGADYLSRKNDLITTIMDSKLDINNVWLVSGLSLTDLLDGQAADENLQKLDLGYKQLQSKKLWKTFKKNGVLMAQKPNSTDELIVIPTDLIDSILEFYHGIDHRGILGMTKSISRKFFIPNMTNRIRKYTRQCSVCIKGKSRKNIPDQPVRQTSSKHPWMQVSSDLIGPFPQSYKGNQYCLVVVDNLTRWTEIRPLPNKQAESVADGFMDIFHRRGLPLSILADNGKEFSNFGLKKMFQKIGCNLQHTTPYRPQSNGLCERVNQKIKKLLRIWNVHDPTWDLYIGAIQFLVNNEFNRILNMSAFQAIHGWTLARIDFMDPSKIENLDITEFDSKQWSYNHSMRMATCLRELFINDVKIKQKSYEKSRNIFKKNVPEHDGEIPIGAHVLIHFPQAVGTNKLMSQWRGTYLVQSRVDKNVYLVSHLEGQRRKMLIHKNRIRILPKNQDGNLDQKDGSDAVAEEIQTSEKSRLKNEHPILVESKRDQSDIKHFDPNNIKTNEQSAVHKKKTKSSSTHGMRLRSQK